MIPGSHLPSKLARHARHATQMLLEMLGVSLYFGEGPEAGIASCWSIPEVYHAED